jgi:hypothetical protein
MIQNETVYNQLSSYFQQYTYVTRTDSNEKYSFKLKFLLKSVPYYTVE